MHSTEGRPRSVADSPVTVTRRKVGAVSSGQAELLTVSEVATMVRVSTMTIYRLLHSGMLPCVRVGRLLRIPRADAEALATPQKGLAATTTGRQ